jgi:hypothetical protein
VLSAAVVAAVSAGLLVVPAGVAAADVVAESRQIAMSGLLSGGPSLRRAAEAALVGSDADLHAFVTTGKAEAQAADERAAAAVLAGVDGPAMRAAALVALDGSQEVVRTFVNGGWEQSWSADERLRVYRVWEAGGLRTREAADQALAGTEEDWTEFLASGRQAAELADDRLMATTMLTGGANNSGPLLDAAAQQALAGTAEELREFLASGQFVARSRDQELASIRSLTEQAKQAGEVTARESLAAADASARAVNAAQEAKKAAQTAAAEARAAGGAAAKASAAAGRAADAAEGAAKAAREAVAASNAAMRAARIAADGARRATTAASLTAQAASRAQRAAADARTDAGKAAAARQAAEAARNAAAKARELQQVRAERDRALAQAKAASDAARSASANANDAAAAADDASRQAGVSAAQAARARNAAAMAQREAAAANRAANRAYSLAQAAAQASDEAFGFAEQAAVHAERAAAAADTAAEQAGIAEKAAEESARHAAAAVEAANVAVSAANQAVTLEQLARQEDATRLAEATEQGVQAAQDALAAEQAVNANAGEIAAWNRKLLWDTEEGERVDPATRTLLNEATAAGAPTEVVLDRGRRAAVALLTTDGDWTKAAAEEALARGEVELRSWLTEGRQFAVGQDNRARLWHLIDTLADGAEKTAAQTALAGDDAAVATFLRTRNYPGKAVNDRRAIYAILDGNPGPNLKAAAERALAGTPAEAHQFLRSGQYPARTADERLEVYRVMEAGGPEVDAAAQVALAGPAPYVSYFLTAGRYEAAQGDLEQAAHVEAVHALIRQAQQYAQTALADAAEANRVAAVARNAADEAQQYAAQAAASAAQAAQHAAAAQTSAAAAKTSADHAAQSAATARNAANSAQASANAAAKSAATAGAAARRARVDAQAAHQAKRDARAAAIAANMDAAAAEEAARQSASIYAAKVQEWENRLRSTEPGSGPGGDGTANDIHRTWGCLAERPTSMSTECIKVYADFAWALVDPMTCNSPAYSVRPGCQMLGDITTFIEENPDVVLDMLQLVLMACGLVPGAGEVCDGIDAAVSFARGDVAGGLLSLGATVPLAGWLSTLGKGGRVSDKLRNVINIVEGLTKGCRRSSSFLTGTQVLLADGRAEEIEDVAVGDSVLSTDPVSDSTAAQPVTGTHASVGSKQIIDLTLAVLGDVDTETGIVSATDTHPFWAPQLGTFVPAGSLAVGQLLQSASGATVQIMAVSKRTVTTRVHNLTIAGSHTYYVTVGDASALVHNCDTLDPDKYNEIDYFRGSQIARGVDYNFKRMCEECATTPNELRQAKDHQLAGIGNDADSLAKYLDEFNNYTHRDPRTGALVGYDLGKNKGDGRGVIVIRRADMVHAYHKSYDEFLREYTEL